jgi:hypothetical protein
MEVVYCVVGEFHFDVVSGGSVHIDSFNVVLKDGGDGDVFVVHIDGELSSGFHPEEDGFFQGDGEIGHIGIEIQFGEEDFRDRHIGVVVWVVGVDFLDKSGACADLVVGFPFRFLFRLVCFSRFHDIEFMDRAELVVNRVIEFNGVVDYDGFQLDVVVYAGGSDCYGVVGWAVFCFRALTDNNWDFGVIVF